MNVSKEESERKIKWEIFLKKKGEWGKIKNKKKNQKW